jgi:hypothetical protein
LSLVNLTFACASFLFAFVFVALLTIGPPCEWFGIPEAYLKMERSLHRRAKPMADSASFEVRIFSVACATSTAEVLAGLVAEAATPGRRSASTTPACFGVEPFVPTRPPIARSAPGREGAHRDGTPAEPVNREPIA